MTDTLTTTGLPTTNDGWTAEVLDIMTDDDSHVGGDIQVGAAPSFRARFVSPDGDVLVMTQYAYVVAIPTDDATNVGLTVPKGELTPQDVEELLESVAEHERASGRPLGEVIDYHFNVVTHLDTWGRDNLDHEHPDDEDVINDWELGSMLGCDTIGRAEEGAREYVRDAASTITRDFYPGNF